jgi:hypothetical protein
MTLEGILLGLVALVIGAAFTFYGFRFFLILLPLWGFVIGFSAGAQLLGLLFGEGFLATISGWVVGFVFGIGFALISYLWYWAAIVLLAGGVGYEIGLGLMALVNITGWLAVAIGLILAVIFVVGAIALHVPRLMIVVMTAIGGAAILTGGVLMVIGTIQPGQLDSGIVGAILYRNWLWGLVFVVLAVAGAYYQLKMQVLPDDLDRASYRYA